MTLHCDLRFAATDARLGQPEISIGFIPPIATTQALARLIGRPRAIRYLYEGGLGAGGRGAGLGPGRRAGRARRTARTCRPMARSWPRSRRRRSPPSAARCTLGGGLTFDDGMALELEHPSCSCRRHARLRRGRRCLSRQARPPIWRWPKHDAHACRKFLPDTQAITACRRRRSGRRRSYFTCGSAITATSNKAIASVSSRSRLVAKLEWSHAASPVPTPRTSGTGGFNPSRPSAHVFRTGYAGHGRHRAEQSLRRNRRPSQPPGNETGELFRQLAQSRTATSRIMRSGWFSQAHATIATDKSVDASDVFEWRAAVATRGVDRAGERRRVEAAKAIGDGIAEDVDFVADRERGSAPPPRMYQVPSAFIVRTPKRPLHGGADTGVELARLVAGGKAHHRRASPSGSTSTPTPFSP